MLSYRVGIWSRLLLAFSFVAGITVLVGIISLLIFNSFEQVVEDLAENYIPEIVQITGFVKIGGEIVAMAPNILSTKDDESREEVSRDLASLLKRLNERLETLTIEHPEMRDSFERLVIHLENNLTALQFSVKERSLLQQRLNRMTNKLRWLYADLIDEVDPLKQDYAYNLDAEIERIVDDVQGRKHIFPSGDLQKIRIAKDSIEKIRSNGVLLVSLMVQGASLEETQQVKNILALSSDAIALLRQDIKKVREDASSLTLRNVLEDIFIMGEGENSIFSVRKKILENETNGREILKNNRRYVEELESVINQILTKAESIAGNATVSTRQTLKRAKTILLLMVLISMVTVAAVMWFYVRGNIIARLSALSRSMRAIARGDLTYEVPKSGIDEIGRMAVALKVFRDTAQAVEDANAQAIIDNAAVGLVLAGSDGLIRFFNPKAEGLFKASAEHMIGSSLYDIILPSDQEDFIQSCRRVLDAEEESSVYRTYSGLCCDLSSFPVDIFIRKVQQRKKTRLMVTVHDVTEREQAQELLRKRVREKTDHLSRINVKLREEVKERRRIEDELVQAGKLAALGTFSAGIAHELNQPLSAIRYYLHNAEKLLERGKTQTHKENLSKIENLIERMAKMINHLKTFARVHPDRLEPINVIESIEEAIELLDEKVERKEVSIFANLQSAPIMAYADSSRLEQVLVNVLSNGIDAAIQTNAGKGELNISVEQVNEGVAIVVCDNGAGISVDPPETVFDPFYTTKEVGRGLGLGLSIAYNIVKGFGGRMIATNPEVGGACFTVILQKVEDDLQ